MGMMDDVMGGMDDDEDRKDLSAYQKPMTIDEFLTMAEAKKPEQAPPAAPPPPKAAPQAVHGPNTGNANHTSGISDNNLRPTKLDEFVGQEHAKTTLKRFIDGSIKNDRTMPHTLLATAPGMGKTTLAVCIANELGRQVFVEQAPIHTLRMVELGRMMQDGDVLIVDEIHLQAKGRTASNGPEVLYHVMEDKKVLTEQGLFNFPDICVIGCTTDLGQLPKSFTERFTLKPVIVDYSDENLETIAEMNASRLDTKINVDAKITLAKASRSTPRVMNNFMKQADFMQKALGKAEVDDEVALMVLENERVEADGLTYDHMRYLHKLWERLRWVETRKEWAARSSLKNMTYALGISDTKYVEREVEPLLIKKGFIAIAGSRELTEKGAKRLGHTFPTEKP